MEGAKVEMGGLESSLIQIIQEHQQRAVYIQDQSDKAKKDALKTAVQVSELLVDAVNGGVQEAFTTEKHIEVEIRALISTIIRYKKQTNQWLAASHALNSVLKAGRSSTSGDESGAATSAVPSEGVMWHILVGLRTAFRHPQRIIYPLIAYSLAKEIGDFENWMKTMDLDCKSINAAIRNIHQA